nr:MAG: terminase large subunit [Caudoviricetes sp.]
MVATASSTKVRYAPRGAALKLLESRAPIVLLDGPVGTGKSYGLLWKAHLLAMKYPGMRAIMLRLTQKSLTESIVQTYVKIINQAPYGVRPFSGNIEEPRSFRYPNGSRIVVGGLDNAGKVMSAEYDLIMVFEATQVKQADVEQLTTRLRSGVMPYQQLLMDCNPDAPTHWLNQAAKEGRLQRLLSRHQDNPLLWDARANDWTPFGREYMDRLDGLTGVRRKRLLDGIWAAAEGQIYDDWDPAIHVVDRFDIPPTWPRIWVIDFGYVHPFVWLWIAIGPDGQMVVYRQIYMTRRLVSDHARQGMMLSDGEPLPSVIAVDHDAEDRATFEAETGLSTTPAIKNVSAGIQAVQNRLRPVVPGAKPRLVFMRDSLVELDQELKQAGKPTCTEDEFGSYVWNLAAKRTQGEEPVKKDDHGVDALRYAVAYEDGVGSGMAALNDDFMDSVMGEYAGYS